jgi:hypothetical protein
MSEPNDPRVFAVGPRRGGRPRATEPGSKLTIWIPARDHDRYCRMAAERGESVSKTVALLLKTRQP